jgi:hypothetical protein
MLGSETDDEPAMTVGETAWQVGVYPYVAGSSAQRYVRSVFRMTRPSGSSPRGRRRINSSKVS